MSLNLDQVSTPCFVIDEEAVKRNLHVLAQVKKRTDCRILLALKAFSMFSLFPLIRKTLDGVCASSPHEARLGREEFGGEVHVFAAAYSEQDVNELSLTADFLLFNSFSQWKRFKPLITKNNREIFCGIRVNPEQSEAPVALYDPCCPGSRLGVKKNNFSEEELSGISGLHFHTLCEQNADALSRTLNVFEEKFGEYLNRFDWINFGGGHHITRSDYDLDLLCELISYFKDKYNVTVYLEPGEAVVLNAGILVASILDIVGDEIETAILDTSAAVHMPDVLEMPYRPDVQGAGQPGEFLYTYRFAGHSCLAGDVMGEYSFQSPLSIDDKVVFLDMAHYTMVKTTTFNGLQLPAIAVYRKESDHLEIIRKFEYADFKTRLS